MPAFANVPTQVAQPAVQVYQRETSKTRRWKSDGGRLLAFKHADLHRFKRGDGTALLNDSRSGPAAALLAALHHVPHGYPSGRIYARLMIGGQRIELNTKIEAPIYEECVGYLIPEVAVKIRDEYHRLTQRQKRGEPISRPSKSLSEAVQDYLAHIDGQLAKGAVKKSWHKNRSEFLKRYVWGWPEAGVTKMHEFGPAQLEEWLDWRDKEASRQLAKGTADKHLIYLKGFLTWAASRKVRLIDAKDIPELKHNEDAGFKAKAQRPRFSPEEWDTLLAQAPSIIQTPRKAHDRLCREGVILAALVCRAFGLRAAEVYALRWGHVTWEKDGTIKAPVLEVPGIKHESHSRTIDPLPPYRKLATVTLGRWAPKWWKRCHGRDHTPADLVFPNPSDAARSLSQSPRVFDSILAEAGLLTSASGHKRSLTSVRHTTISECIESTGTPVGVIADWAGTSITMIEEHYSQPLTRRAMKEGFKNRVRL